MSDSPQTVSAEVVDDTGTVIVNDSRPDNLADDEFWPCTHRAVIKAACAIQERDGVISDSGVFVSPDEGWEEESVVRFQGLQDVARAKRFIAAKFPGWKIVETDSDGKTTVVGLSTRG
jgi:hypothetical protein